MDQTYDVFKPHSLRRNDTIDEGITMDKAMNTDQSATGNRINGIEIDTLAGTLHSH